MKIEPVIENWMRMEWNIEILKIIIKLTISGF